MRSAGFVVALAWKRLVRRESGALVTAAGLAAATAALAGVLAGTTIATDRATADAIERIPAAQRSVRAAWFGIPGAPTERLPVLDRAVSDAFDGLALDGPTPLVLFRESTVAGRFVGITAIDGLAGDVVLRSGRLPATCTAARCEVLRLRGSGRLPDTRGLHLVPVGRATLRSRQLYGDFLRSTDEASRGEPGSEYHRPAPAPLVVAEGRAALASAAPLARTYRTYSWVWPIAPGRPRLWEIDELIDRTERARVDLAATASAFAVEVPVEELRAAEHAADVAGTRLLLVGGEGVALLLAFTILAARGMRRDLEAARRRLTWSGAQRWQLGLLGAVESGVVALGGVVAGWLAGILVAGGVALAAGAPVVPVVMESVLSPLGLGLAAAAAVAAALLVWLTVSLPSRDDAPLGVLDVVALVALVIVGVTLASGAADEERLARGDGVALLLLLLPGFVAVAAALIVARVFPVLAGRWSYRQSPVATRLAAVGLARGPGAAVATAAFLTIAFAMAFLAMGYRATLVRSDREQAAFSVPHEIVVREDLRNLVPVFDAASPQQFAALAGPAGTARPVLRITGGAGRAERVTGVTVLGLDGDAIEHLGVWRKEWSSGRGTADLASLVAPTGSTEMRGATVDDGVLELGIGPGLVSLAAVVRLEDGSFRRVVLGAANPRRPSTLTARVPARALLTSLEIVPPPRLIERGADAGIALEQDVRLTGALARELRGWSSVGGVVIRPDPDGIRVRASLTLQRSSGIRAPQPTDARPPKVLVTPRLAELAGGVGGTLTLQIGGEAVPVRVEGVVARFPGANGETVVGDRGALTTAIETVAPGAARANEIWLDVPPDDVERVAAALTRAPFRPLDTTVRAEVEAEARSDPLARGTLLALAGTALVALLLAALGLVLAVRADLRDDSGEHFDLEAQGAAPAFLRRVVRARAATVSAVGLAGGLLTGLLLVLLVTRVVTVTAGGGEAQPPLAVVIDPALVVAGVALFAALAAALVGAATRRAFAGSRGPAYRETD